MKLIYNIYIFTSQGEVLHFFRLPKKKVVSKSFHLANTEELLCENKVWILEIHPGQSIHKTTFTGPLSL